jgi:hypothetical protein
MKQLDLRFFWLRDEVEACRIAPKFIRTKEMPADILTKALPCKSVVHCKEMLGLEEIKT